MFREVIMRTGIGSFSGGHSKVPAFHLILNSACKSTASRLLVVFAVIFSLQLALPSASGGRNIQLGLRLTF